MRTRRWLAAGAGAVAAALVVTACGSGEGSGSGPGDEGEPVKGGTLNMLGVGDVDYMDPNISYYSAGYTVLRLWSRQLFTYPAVEGGTTEEVPDLATEMPTTDNGGISEDGKTYTIRIQPDAAWNTSPKRTVTADDVVRGVKRTCNPAQPFGGLPNYVDLIVGLAEFCSGFEKVDPTPQAIASYIDGNDVAGVTAKDEKTVVFTLAHPAPYFTGILTLTAMSPAPKEFLEYTPASAELGQHTISDGPYKIDSYQPTKEITLSRNPAWVASSDPVRKAYVDKVVVSESGNQNSILQQLQTGTPSADMQFDIAVPPAQLPKLVSAKDPNLTLGVTSSSGPYVIFNTVSPNNARALSKVAVRQALSHAIDRSHLVQVLGGEKVNPPLTHVLPSTLLGSEEFDLYPHDVTKAKQLLAQAGYPNGLTLTVLYRNKSEGQSKVFQTLQGDLKEVGITVKGLQAQQADFYTKYLQVPAVAKRGEWDIAMSSWGSDWYGNAALSFFKPLFSGKSSFPPVGSNFGFYDNPTTNVLIDEASKAATDEDAKKLWAAADKQTMKDAPIYPITNALWPTYKASQVHHGVYIPVLQSLDPANVWLEKGKQGG
ncbi:ABC transporter substrate-binding protein [Mumia sp. zg.B21]|uniref:ABC transporter substrate-binding protein n=1 Tax=Mumia sp. zg.B21 TaxID=2855447 RepID=UPI001C6E7734|nr:ABC transporter substrate-binding protein [Mumia sp. zg.B21]MBW9208083.1 ABC transporter substrate-binding protein [Mumia sp. zg.B21]